MHDPHFNIIFLIIRIVYMMSYHVDSYSHMHDKPIQMLCPASCRKAFFALGNIGAFHENLNPLSGRSIFEACIIPRP